ncbi:unnamed protein product [Fraxinus pennsylvanica]|uniref:Uncharacterized protein n=1 Tax=Fraxinus pennsylvanica TaxID=56036 RepID=A0AAD1ZU27_9LAMI|nr:unnamed protein product [Fraxinus pennsylvanica]
METFYFFQCLVGKRPVDALNGAGNSTSKKGRGSGNMQNQYANRAFESLSHGGRSGSRGSGRSRGRGGRWRWSDLEQHASVPKAGACRARFHLLYNVGEKLTS